MKPTHTFRGVVMVEAGEAPVARPAANAGPPKIRVAREVAGRGGKGVTVITGLPLAPDALEELAERAQAQPAALAGPCAATGSRSRGITATGWWRSWGSWAMTPNAQGDRVQATRKSID